MRFAVKPVVFSLGASMIALLSAVPALGQSTAPAAFVANNGNLEGSVTAFRFDANGAPIFVNRIVTGTRSTTSQPCSGCNAYTISITPDGKHLAVGHPAGDPPNPRGLTIFRVSGDASITQVLHLPLINTNSPLGVRWISNEHLAVTRTSTTSSSNGLAVYAFDPNAPSLTVIDSHLIFGFTSTLEVHPNGNYLFAQTTGPNAMHVFRINANGTLTPLKSYPSGNYPLGQGISPDGTRLYAAGGISGNVVSGWWITPSTGALTMMNASPFAVPSSSPKQVVVSSDNRFAFVGYGGGGFFRNFAIDQKTGALTFLGFAMSVGTTGSLGELAVLDNLLLVCDRDTISDGARGLRVFAIDLNGGLTPTAPIIDTQGIAPNAVVGWKPPVATCLPDITGDGVVNVNDLLAVINAWGACPMPCPPCPADVTGDCQVNVNDLLMVINAWGPCS